MPIVITNNVINVINLGLFVDNILSCMKPIPSNIKKGIIGNKYLVNLTSKLPVINKYGMTQDKIIRYL